MSEFRSTEKLPGTRRFILALLKLKMEFRRG